MKEHEYRPLGTIARTSEGMQSTLDDQDILIRQSDIGQTLACLLGFGKADLVRQGDATYWRIVHNRQADDLLVELIDSQMRIIRLTSETALPLRPTDETARSDLICFWAWQGSPL